MKCVSMTGMLLAFCALSVTGENFESFRPLEQEKLMVSCGFEEDNPPGLRPSARIAESSAQLESTAIPDWSSNATAWLQPVKFIPRSISPIRFPALLTGWRLPSVRRG